MDFTFTTEQEAFRKEVREFGLREIAPYYENPPSDGAHAFEEWHDGFKKQLARKFAARGWLGLAWPEEYGGHPATWVEQLIFKEEMGYYESWGLPRQAINMAGPAILNNGTEEQKRRLLPPIAKGESWWCQGYSEPGAGSDLASVQTRAVLEGDVFRVSGQKIWTSHAYTSDMIFFLARSDPNAPKHRGISFLVADMRTPGITVRPIIQMDGVGDDFNEVFFDDARIPKENLIGGLHQGWYVAMNQLSGERSQIEFVALLKRRLDDLTQYVTEYRPQDAGDLRAGQVRNRLADLYIGWTVARLLNYRVAWMVSTGENSSTAASLCKGVVGPLAQHIGATAMRVLGPWGELGAYGERDKWAPVKGRIMLWYLRAVSRTFNAGTHEIQQNIIATRGLGLPQG